ncbi:WG repeat-containing protein [Micromonospora sp. RTP1Z1]|uniref:WG repeat-containing protein n=1 Tax=Micromonospora sp. RTP1Z1 TaxID=2994043 RepID=UPI0029C7AE59|nr:WG repeat-containing protein [Micromonospora sp. RTP1Z1]
MSGGYDRWRDPAEPAWAAEPTTEWHPQFPGQRYPGDIGIEYLTPPATRGRAAVVGRAEVQPVSPAPGDPPDAHPVSPAAGDRRGSYPVSPAPRDRRGTHPAVHDGGDRRGAYPAIAGPGARPGADDRRGGDDPRATPEGRERPGRPDRRGDVNARDPRPRTDGRAGDGRTGDDSYRRGPAQPGDRPPERADHGPGRYDRRGPEWTVDRDRAAGWHGDRHDQQPGRPESGRRMPPPDAGSPRPVSPAPEPGWLPEPDEFPRRPQPADRRPDAPTWPERQWGAPTAEGRPAAAPRAPADRRDQGFDGPPPRERDPRREAAPRAETHRDGPAAPDRDGLRWPAADPHRPAPGRLPGQHGDPRPVGRAAAFTPEERPDTHRPQGGTRPRPDSVTPDQRPDTHRPQGDPRPRPDERPAAEQRARTEPARHRPDERPRPSTAPDDRARPPAAPVGRPGPDGRPARPAEPAPPGRDERRPAGPHPDGWQRHPAEEAAPRYEGRRPEPSRPDERYRPEERPAFRRPEERQGHPGERGPARPADGWRPPAEPAARTRPDELPSRPVEPAPTRHDDGRRAPVEPVARTRPDDRPAAPTSGAPVSGGPAYPVPPADQPHTRDRSPRPAPPEEPIPTATHPVEVRRSGTHPVADAPTRPAPPAYRGPTGGPAAPGPDERGARVDGGGPAPAAPRPVSAPPVPVSAPPVPESAPPVSPASRRDDPDGAYSTAHAPIPARPADAAPTTTGVGSDDAAFGEPEESRPVDIPAQTPPSGRTVEEAEEWFRPTPTGPATPTVAADGSAPAPRTEPDPAGAEPARPVSAPPVSAPPAPEVAPATESISWAVRPVSTPPAASASATAPELAPPARPVSGPPAPDSTSVRPVSGPPVPASGSARPVSGPPAGSPSAAPTPQPDATPEAEQAPERPEPPTDPEQALAAFRWRLDPETLREETTDPGELRAVRDGLTGKLGTALDNRSRARLLSLRSVASRILGDLDDALADGRLAVTYAEATGELRRTALARARLAQVLRWRGEHAEADRLFAEANSPELPDRLRAALHEHAGRSCYDQGRLIEACHHFERALDLCQGADPELVTRTGVALGAVRERAAAAGFGPWPRDRDAMLRSERFPVPTFDEERDLWGYADAEGNLVIDHGYAEVQPFREGMAWVRRPDASRWALIDSSGAALIEANNGYRAVGVFSDGLAWVSMDGKGNWMAVDPTNMVKIPPGFEDVRPFHGGLAAVRRGGWGAVDRTGQLVVPTRYHGFSTALADGRHVDGFTEEGLAVVELAGRRGVVDRTGRVLVEPAYPGLVIHPVAFLVGAGSGRWGALDRRGEPLIDPVHPSRAEVVAEIDRLLTDTSPVL